MSPDIKKVAEIIFQLLCNQEKNIDYFLSGSSIDKWKIWTNQILPPFPLYAMHDQYHACYFQTQVDPTSCRFWIEGFQGKNVHIRFWVNSFTNSCSHLHPYFTMSEHFLGGRLMCEQLVWSHLLSLHPSTGIGERGKKCKSALRG